MITKADLIASSSLAWILDGNFVTENNKPIEFNQHKYLIDYLADDHDDICSIKASQVGATVIETLDEIHAAYYKGWNTIHTLQNSDVIRGFVVPKVNPIINNNPAIKRMAGVDSENLKQFGKGYVFYRGAQAESQAINISADVLKIDEMDRSDPKVVEMFQSRLDASEISKVRRFSNPSAIGFGVDALWQKSNQFHWFVRCSHCNHYIYIDWDKDAYNCHYVDKQRAIYACGKCDREIYNIDRATGEWVAKYYTRTSRHGYWFSQLMVPRFSAAKIIKKFEDNSIDYFYNFTLGKAYTPADLLFDRDTILRNTFNRTPILNGCVMGTDVGKPHWYWLATPSGYFRYGHTESWEELEYLFKFYRCEAWVIDAMPEWTPVKTMIDKYPGKVWACYFTDNKKRAGIVEWGNTPATKGIVNADRTKVIDRYVTEIATGVMPIFSKETELEDFIIHAGNIWRATEEDENGKVKTVWKSKKPDHLVFAGVYCRMALEKVFSGNGGVTEMEVNKVKVQQAPTIEQNTNIMVEFDIEESIRRAQAGRQ